MNQYPDFIRTSRKKHPDAFDVYTINRMLNQNIDILKIGIIKSFDAYKQDGKVIIPSFNNLVIYTKNISNVRLTLNQGDKVVLIQSSVDIFNEKDSNFFDKNHFYILSHIMPNELTLKAPKVIINGQGKPIDFHNQYDNLNSVLMGMVNFMQALVTAIGTLYELGKTAETGLNTSGDLTRLRNRINNLLN